jgi:SAM-dependent methyltransferase
MPPQPPHGGTLDHPSTTAARRAILARKKFLRSIYDEWYGLLVAAIPAGRGKVLEIGSGAGFLRERVPDLIRSEILEIPGVSVILDGCHLPFSDGSLGAIVMTDVLHHIPDVRRFFAEAARAVRPGGVVAMIEPWRTPWSEWVYRNLHHEPFDPATPRWEFDSTGPLSSANGALPWILFERDRAEFAREFPQWSVESLRPMMPLRYLLSGGFSRVTLQPGFTFGMWKGIERAGGRWMHRCAMFAAITLRRGLVR